MTVIALPDNAWFDKVSRFELTRTGTALRSKYTGARQQVSFPLALWAVEATMVPKSGADAAAWRAFMVELNGQRNKFRLPVPGCDGPLSGYSARHPASGGMTAGTIAARSKSMTTRGWFGLEPLLMRGDYFTVNDELKM